MSGVLARCMQGDPLYPKKSINKRQMTRMLRQTNAWAKSGKIDATANLASQRIWLFHGYNDGVVKAAVTDALYAFYAHYVNSGQIFYKNNLKAGHADNAMALARALESVSAVSRVHYGGLGGMMAFDLDGGRHAVQRMIERFQLVRFAASLGGVETTVSYPEITSHRSMTAEERASLGVGPGTVRVSVGIEDPDDIVADFTQALSRSC